MKKILFILFAVQFALTPQIIKSYSTNSIGDNRNYSAFNQGRKTIKKDILGNITVQDIYGNRKTIKTDIFGNTIIEDSNGGKIVIEKDVLDNITIEDY